MNCYVRTVLILAISGLAGIPAMARNADGTLGLILIPNNGIPAIMDPQGTFEAVLEEEAALSLSNGSGEWPLAVDWSRRPDGKSLGLCHLETPIPAGAYTLQAKAGDRTDSNLRSIYVLEAFPEAYQVAHITDIHTGTTRHTRPDEEIIAEVIEAINASEAAFALVTGDLTENGEPEQFRDFLALLDTCRLPTFVVPGNHDRQDSHYQHFFGPLTYRFFFGPDGYLAFDTKDFMIADEMSGQDGLLHLYRRQMRAARWSIGFTHRYDVTMGVRAQITLFVDDPLDYIVCGHTHREPGEQDGIPWGSTRLVMTPAAIDGKLRFLKVDNGGVQGMETTSTTAAQQEGE